MTHPGPLRGSRPRGVVLAAGLGTRLRPLTDELPKAVVPVAGRPAAAWALSAMAREGIRHVSVNTHWLPDRVESVLGDGDEWGVRITWSREPGEILGTGGGIRAALERSGAGKGPVVVMNGDVVSDVDLGALIDRHAVSGAAATLLLVPRPDVDRFGSVHLGEDGMVLGMAGRRIHGRPTPGPGERALVFSGVHVLGEEAIRRLPESGCVVRTTYLGLLQEGGRIAGLVHEGHWSDIGCPAEYLRCNRDIIGGAAGGLVPRGRLEGGSLFGEGVSIGKGARVGSGVVLADGATVAAGADLEGCVVWGGAVAGGTLRSAIVGRTFVVNVEGARS